MPSAPVEEKPDGQKGHRGAVQYVGFGMQLAVTFALFVVGGWWLDTKFDTLPLFFIVGIICASIAFIYLLRKLHLSN